MTKFASHETGLRTWSRRWEVQRTPYRVALPFSYTCREESRYPFLTDDHQVNDITYTRTIPTGADRSRLDNVITLARSKAVSQIKDGRGAALALTLLDWRSSLSLITGAMKSLASKADRKRLYYKKRSSALYLEGVFGWLPMMQDIYDAYETLSGSHRTSPVRAKNSMVYSQKVTNANERVTVQTELSALVGAQGRMQNPNLALLGDLGLINPLAVAWDKVPYSFVVNWFVPVGGYLNSLTDLVGYETEDAFVTTFVRKTAAGQIREYNPVNGKLEWRSRSVRSLYVDRNLGFPIPSFPPFQLPSADLFKSLVTLSLLNENLRKPPRNPPRTE